MPRKKSAISPATRIRENQRRSRARRHDLIQHLQDRLHDYEQRELQATLAMQLAARQVSWENTQLRALLAGHGVSAIEINVFLGARERSEGRIPSRPAETEQAADAVDVNRGSTSFGHEASEASGSNKDIEHDDFLPAILDDFLPVSSVADSSARKGSRGEMSCETAAGIITGMRAVVDKDEVWGQLGCVGSETCKVETVRVMGVMGQD